MQYKHIFWDFNGTVIDDVGVALTCVNDMLERRGKPHINMAQYYDYVETPIIGFYRHILTPEELDFDVISRDYHADYARHGDMLKLADGIYDLIHELKEAGVHQYIITATHSDEANELLVKFGIRDCFEEVLGAGNLLAESKSGRALELFDSLCIDRNEAIFIGDTLHDLETANVLGIDCILVSYGHQGKKLINAHGAFTVDTPAGIKRVLYDERVIDLHTHSSRSDGTLTPAELVCKAKEIGLTAIALTDHDSVDGIAEAAAEAAKIGIEFVPGIELSTAQGAEIHILGLFIDPENEELQNTINTLRESRSTRMARMCENLQKLGFDITLEDAAKESGSEKFTGRPHIALAMVKKGYCATVQECFDKYIGFGKLAYVKKAVLTANDAVKLVRKAGGVAVFAHPHQTGFDNDKLDELIKTLKKDGLNAVEGYYTEFTREHISDFRALAEKNSLMLSGGSDYHGASKMKIALGKGYGNLRIPYFVLENIKNLHKNQ